MDEKKHEPVAAFDLRATFVHLDDDGTAALLPVGEDFWTSLDPRLDRGRLVSRFGMEGQWQNWEMHPAGDELIFLISGRLTFIMEESDGLVSRTEAGPGEAILIPRGRWHTVDAAEPCDAIFVTPGQGTQHRPREDS